MEKTIDGQDNNNRHTHWMPAKFTYPNNLIAAVEDIDPIQLIDESYSNDQLIGISTALSLLTEQEEAIIIMRFKQGATLQQIGEYYGFTYERARQLIYQAIIKLRNPSRYRLIKKGFQNNIADDTDHCSESKS